jgi:hypothetical protein
MMLTNPETGISENRSYLNAEGVLFTLANTTYRLSAIDRIISMASATTTTLLPIGAISTLQIINPATNDSCQISLSHDLVGAAKALNLDSHYLANPNFQNYLYDKSGLMRLFNASFRGTLLTTDFQKLELQ